MGKIPVKVHSIERSSAIVIDLNSTRNICYTIMDDDAIKTDIYVKLPCSLRPEKSEKIIDDSNEFVNGFKVVQTENGEYAYVRESDNLLIPFRYDVATNFNEFGYAMIGRDGSVTWINTKFEFLDLHGDFVVDKTSKFFELNSWQRISKFSDGDIPLSRLYNGTGRDAQVAYLNIDGSLKSFIQYDGVVTNPFEKTFFTSGSEFNKNGFAGADSCVLTAKGYICSYADVVQICMEKGYLDSIFDDADKQYKESFARRLKK